MIRADGAKATGFMELFGPEKEVQVWDTFTCQHDSKVVKVPPFGLWKQTWCKKCMGLVCEQCAAKPCFRFIDEQEKLARQANFPSGL